MERDTLISGAREAAQAPAAPALRVLLVGDSILANFPAGAYLPAWTTPTNRAVGGLSAAQIRARHAGASGEPRDLLILDGGINDVLGGDGKDVAATMRTIIEAEDRAKILVVSVTPVTHRFLLPYLRACPLPTPYDPEDINSQIDRVNAELRALCDGERVVYVDAATALKDEGGYLSRRYGTPDGYHINQAGYRLLASILTSHL